MSFYREDEAVWAKHLHSSCLKKILVSLDLVVWSSPSRLGAEVVISSEWVISRTRSGHSVRPCLGGHWHFIS